MYQLCICSVPKSSDDFVLVMMGTSDVLLCLYSRIYVTKVVMSHCILGRYSSSWAAYQVVLEQVNPVLVQSGNRSTEPSRRVGGKFLLCICTCVCVCVCVCVCMCVGAYNVYVHVHIFM